MKHLCKESKKKVARDAEKVRERQAEGKSVYQCERCKRFSHKEDHLCQPVKIKAEKPTAVVEDTVPALEVTSDEAPKAATEEKTPEVES